MVHVDEAEDIAQRLVRGERHVDQDTTAPGVGDGRVVDVVGCLDSGGHVVRRVRDEAEFRDGAVLVEADVPEFSLRGPVRSREERVGVGERLTRGWEPDADALHVGSVAAEERKRFPAPANLAVTAGYRCVEIYALY